MKNNILTLVIFSIFSMSLIHAQDDCFYSFLFSVENESVSVEIENLDDVYGLSFTLDGQTMYSNSDILSLSLSSVIQPVYICAEFYSPSCDEDIQICQFVDISFLLNFSSSDGCTDITLIDPNSDCDFVYEPVCGCNGITYINSCEATNYAGVLSWTLGPCETSDEDNSIGNDTDEEEYDEDDNGWWHGDACDEECDGNCWWENNDDSEDDFNNDQIEEGCYDLNGVLYGLGDTYEYSEDFCENYTCVYWFGYQFVQNWEVYPSCQQTDEIISGCTILEACNFNPNANQNDGTCDFISCLSLGCIDINACNYDPSAEYEDGSCVYPELGFDCDEEFEGCVDDNGAIYSVGSEWFISDCEFFVCEGSNNWSEIQIIDDCFFDCDVEIILSQSSENPCLFEFSLMTDSEFIGSDGSLLAEIVWDFGDGNFDFESGMQTQHIYELSGVYNVTATYWNANCGLSTIAASLEAINCGECILDSDSDGICDDFEIFGCTIFEACNYNPDATESDNSLCDFISCLSLGCTDPFACNYDPTAEYEDGSCIYPEIGFDCDEEFEGCYNDNDLFFPIGGEWFITDCEFFVCEGQNSWSDINVLDDCLGCFDDFGVFYSLGQELFLDSSGCAFIFCETPNNWSDIVVVPNCNGLGCYDANGNLYLNNEELIVSDNDCDNLTCIQSESGFEFVSNFELYPDCNSTGCNFSIEASSQDDVPCNLNWLFQLNGIEEETDNIFWDFGDGTSGDASWVTEHTYETDGIYLVTAFVFTPSCQLVTVITEIVVEGCNEEDIGCFDTSGIFYGIGSEWYLTDCEFFVCEGQNSWSDINVLDDCLGCFDDFGVFYNLGSELFLGEDSCSFIFCESPGSWSEVIEIPDCAGAGCYSDDGVFYNVGDEMYLNDCEYTYCESPGNWSEIQIIAGCDIDCNFSIEASSQDDVPCNLNWLFQLNGIEEETDNIFWDFGDGTSGDASWVTEHTYETDGIYLVTAFVFTPSCQLVTVVTEIIVEGCDVELGCHEGGVFYPVGSIIYLNDCEYVMCEWVDTWSDVLEIEDCGDDECVDESIIDPEMACYDIWAPVCGCDGVTYSNDCYAYYYHGVTQWTEGECGGSTGDCTIDVDGWYQGGFGMFEAYNYPEGVNLHWWINGELYEDETSFIEVDNLEYYAYYEDVVDICVGYVTDECGEVYECMQITLDGEPENPCPLELWSGVQGGIAMFEAYDYPEGVYLFWVVNGENIENQGHYLEIDMNLIDVDFLEVCVGYESPDCLDGVFECTSVEVDDNTGGGDGECDGSIEVIPPNWDMCHWAFALEGVDENCSVTWDFGDGTSGPGSTWEAHSYLEDGTYIVTATYYTDACLEGVTIVVTIQVEGCDTSVEEIVDGANWSVYPVPTSDNISLRGLPAGTWSAKLFDSTGRVVLQSDVSNGYQLDVNQLKSGMYTMQIVGLTTSAKRVVVQR